MEKGEQFTRCPQCKTAFKVTDKLLSMAKGKVRCGACLAVFQATDHLVQPSLQKKINDSHTAVIADEATPPTQSQQPVEGKPSPEVSPSPVKEPEEVLPEQTILDDDGQKETVSETAAETETQTDTVPAEPEADQLTDADVSTENQVVTDGIPDFEPASDDFELADDTFELDNQPEREAQQQSFDLAETESLGLTTEGEREAYHFEESEDLSPAIEHEPKMPELDSDQDLVLEEAGDLAHDPEMTFEEPQADTVDFDSATDQKAEETFEAEINETAFEPVEPLVPEADTFDSPLEIEGEAVDELDAENFEDGGDDRLDDETVSPSESEPELSIDEETEDFELLANTLASQIEESGTEPDPLDEFEERVEDKRTGVRNLVIGAIMASIIGVASVQFWSNRQTLAWSESWGGMTKSLCSVLPCDLKPRRDVDKIKLRQRIVSPSESNENLLQVKILLTNDADFAQPYPGINIQFSNSLGERVATRHFTVKDYFPEKVDALIPSGAEVHISFETELPHPDALGFEFSFD